MATLIVRANSNRSGYEWPNHYEVDSEDQTVKNFIENKTFTVVEVLEDDAPLAETEDHAIMADDSDLEVDDDEGN